MLEIQSDYPGGNIIVDRVDGDTLHVRPDHANSSAWWFYFNFRITGAAGRRVNVVFAESPPLAARGPCVRMDDGPWAWLGAAADFSSFTLDVPAGVKVVQCCTAVPYTQADLDRFVQQRPDLKVDSIGQTDAGRPIPRIVIPARARRHTLVLTARSHACESMASFVLEGIVDAWRRADDALAKYRRDAIDLEAVPFTDGDGIEAGDQGKFRSPHDHNRDWTDAPIYASVRAMQPWLKRVADEETVAFDLHCPWIRNGRNETLFFCGVAEPMQRELAAIQSYIPRDAGDALPYDPADDIAINVEWNLGNSSTTTNWLRNQRPVRVATTIEIPYARAHDTVVTPERCRAWGGRLADAVTRYFQVPRRLP